MTAEPRRYQGEVVEWNEEKRCGFLQPRGSQSRDDMVFFPLNAMIERRKVPKVGDNLTYELERLADSPQTRHFRTRWKAKRVAFGDAEVPRSSDRSTGRSMVPLGIAYFVALAGAAAIFRALFSVLLLSLIASAITFALYGWDKSAAKRDRSRIPEARLHMAALFGGWPGAALAQKVFRHKTQKQPFQSIFRAIVFANIAGTIAISALLASG